MVPHVFRQTVPDIGDRTESERGLLIIGLHYPVLSFAGIFLNNAVNVIVFKYKVYPLKRCTCPVTPNHAPSIKSLPKTRSAFIGGGMITLDNLAKPKRL